MATMRAALQPQGIAAAVKALVVGGGNVARHAQHIERLAPVVSDIDLVAILDESHLEDGEGDLVVVGDQDAHGLMLLCRAR